MTKMQVRLLISKWMPHLDGKLRDKIAKMAEYLLNQENNVYLQSMSMASVFKPSLREHMVFRDFCKCLTKEDDSYIKFRASYYLDYSDEF